MSSRLKQRLQEKLEKFEVLITRGDTEGEKEAARTKADLIRAQEGDLLDHIDAVWENYIFTQHPKALAEYIELGGDIDDDVCAAIVTQLREGPPKKKGSRDNLRDVEVYMAIEDIRFHRTIEIIAKFEEIEKKQTLGQTFKSKETPSLPKPIKQAEARRKYIKRTGLAVQDDTIQKQYERGREILKGRKKGK